VTGTRPERPVLATLICIWEVFTIVLAIASYMFLEHMLSAHPSIHPHPTTLLHSISSWLFPLLAAAAAITLWQMRRAAFFLLAARFAMSLLWFLAGLPRLFAQHWPTLPPGSPGAINVIAIRWGAILFSIVSLALSGSIAWYAYDITTPEALSPHDPEAHLTPDAPVSPPAFPPSQNQ
jgi:hypothetical protein